MKGTADDIRRVVDDLGFEITSSDDAMFAIGLLDALASTVARRYRRNISDSTAPAAAVLRYASQRQTTEASSKLLNQAAGRAKALQRIAASAEYGELPSDEIRHAERVRSKLHDSLSEWLDQLER